MAQAFTPALPLPPEIKPIITALSVEMSKEWAENPIIETKPKTARELILEGNRATTTVREYLSLEDENNGLGGILVAIAQAESNFLWNAKNPISSAQGVFQWIDSSWLHFCSDTLEDKLDPILQTECAVKVLKEEGGWRHWSESMFAWKRLVDNPQDLDLRSK